MNAFIFAFALALFATPGSSFAKSGFPNLGHVTCEGHDVVQRGNVLYVDGQPMRLVKRPQQAPNFINGQNPHLYRYYRAASGVHYVTMADVGADATYYVLYSFSGYDIIERANCAAAERRMIPAGGFQAID